MNMNLCIGGTFSPLHKGHRLLFETAMANLGTGMLYIGLTCDGFATSSRPREALLGYQERKKALEAYLERVGCRRYSIVEIDRTRGIADRSIYLEGIVVSRETYPHALDINKARVRRGFGQLDIFVVNLVKNRQGKEIRARYIRNNEMDREGRPR